MTQQLRQTERTGHSSLTGQVRNTELVFKKADGYAGSVNGVVQRRNRVITRPGSDGITIYTAQEWLDETTGDTRYSCNCPGWTRFSARSGERWCSHTKELASDMSLNETRQTATPAATTADKQEVPQLRATKQRQRRLGG